MNRSLQRVQAGFSVGCVLQADVNVCLYISKLW